MPSRRKPAKPTSSPRDDFPKRRQCGTMQVHNRLLEAHPDFRLRQGDLEHLTLDRRRRGLVQREGGPITIPVVVHVVYNTAAQKNSAAQVKSQIAALNRDYAAKNPDKANVPEVWSGMVTDTGVQFAL